MNAVSRDFQIFSTPKLWSYDDERMRFTTYDFLPGDFPTRIHQANGYFGASSSMAGPSYEKDTNQGKRDREVTEGWPLYDQRQTFSTISGFFDVQDATKASNFPELMSSGWESVISGVPHPFGFNLVVDGIVLNATTSLMAERKEVVPGGEGHDNETTIFVKVHPDNSPNVNASDRRRDLDYYMHVQSPDGPAMTYAISAIAENQNAISGCAAHTYHLRSTEPNYRAPWIQMSEQSVDDSNKNGGFPPAFPFLTGHGANLQLPLFGWLGVKLNTDVLTLSPSLPPTSAKDATKPGQLFGAVTDGNWGTRCQPLSSNRTHLKVTLDESVPFQRIEEIRIEWRPRKPTQARIGFSHWVFQLH
ncbi:hypothetical protein BP5796_00282 [Coleophoma crateriformis]|uniref:Uncharacterized protein n=1 Tax=Coleophoma crateriformis TaxID=565419 RepID=A0A3D8T7J3_9HELO|nr:hypothetical protein BP5796_00282 [Coleophoma crateriformis]